MILFSREAYDSIVHHAYTGDDEEICGVLAGTHGSPESRVFEVWQATNVAETPQIRYRIDPTEQFEIVEAIENDGQDVVGFYHSHPSGPPTPSETDLDRATWPNRSYVICALDGHPFVGSWRYRDETETFEQETVAVRDTLGSQS
jgi:proteasome lid subunit RPN8/RPN11